MPRSREPRSPRSSGQPVVSCQPPVFYCPPPRTPYQVRHVVRQRLLLMHRLDRPWDKLQQLLLGCCRRCPRPRLAVALRSVLDQPQQPPRLRLRIFSGHDGADHRDAVEGILARAAAEQHLRDVGGVDAPDAHGGDAAVALLGEDG